MPAIRAHGPLPQWIAEQPLASHAEREERPVEWAASAFEASPSKEVGHPPGGLSQLQPRQYTARRLQPCRLRQWVP